MDEQTESNRYRLLELLREGVAGKVYRARDTRDNSTVLLKLVPLALSRDPQFRRYFYERWAEREATIEHPNIARIIEVGRIGEQYFAVVEDLPGERLSDRLPSAPLDPDEALSTMRQIAEALRAAHRENIVHGHLKPTDIFLTKDHKDRLQAKVLFLDLGTESGDGVLALFGDLSGPPKYMAPEVIRGRVPSTQSDLFALGVIAYEMLTGMEPFPADHPIGYLFSNCESPLTPPHQVNPNVPKELSLVVCRCLAKDPGQRYGSAQRIIDDLDRVVECLKTGHVSVVPNGTDSAFARDYEIPSHAPAAPPRRSLPAVAAASVLVVVLTLAAVGAGGYALVSTGRLKFNLGPAAPQPPLPSGTQTTPERAVQPARAETEEERTAAMAAARARNARAAISRAISDWVERYSLAGTYDLAAAAFRKVAEDYPDLAEGRQGREMAAQVYCEWAKADVRKGDPKEAEAHLRQAVAYAPQGSPYSDLARGELPKVLAAWAQDDFERGFYEDALAKYEQIRREFPSSLEASLLQTKKPSILFRIGYTLWKQEGKLDEALARMQVVVDEFAGSDGADECNKNLPDLYIEVARSRIAQGQMGDARDKLAMIRQKYPDSPAAKQAADMQGEVLYKLFEQARTAGAQDKVDACLSELMKHDPSSRWAVAAAAEKLDLAPGPKDEPIQIVTARTALEKAGQDMAAMQYAAARAALEGLVRLAPRDSDVRGKALYALAECLYREALYAHGSGKSDQAIDQLKKLAARYSFSPRADNALRTLHDAESAPEGMVYVPEGPFYMGAARQELVDFLKPRQPANLFESPEALDFFLNFWAYSAELPGMIAQTTAFYIDRTEVTNEDYKKFVDATGHKPPAHWTGGKYPAGTEKEPVRKVTYEDAVAYAEWAGKRLPTEAEWEKAARGTDKRLFPWGSSWDPKFCRHLLPENESGPTVVGGYPRYGSPYGCLDMIGNVMEWTSSMFAPYEGSSLKPGEEPFDAVGRARRGGAWYSQYVNPVPTRCSARHVSRPNEARSQLDLEATGFRCVKDIH